MFELQSGGLHLQVFPRPLLSKALALSVVNTVPPDRAFTIFTRHYKNKGTTT